MSLFGKLWRILSLPCRAATRLSSESLDRELDAFERLALKSHLLLCVYCRRFRTQLNLLRRALRLLANRLEVEDAADEIRLPDHVRRQIKQFLKEH